MLQKKRGQAAIFMIVALIILFVGVFFFFANRAALEQPESINPEVLPVKNFVDACITNVAREAITLLGLNGGYITIPEEIGKDPRSYLQLGPGAKSPYWWHEGIETIPSESFMASQIEDYVALNLDSCISDFGEFGSQFSIRPRGSMEVDAVINENDVTIDVNYPVDVVNSLNSTIIRLEDFKQVVQVRLKKAYEAAKDVYEAEKRSFFLEFKTIDLISMDETIPTTGIDVTCSEKTWQIGTIEKKLKRLLASNFPYINVVGSEFNDNLYVPNPFGDDNYRSSYYNSHYKWTVSDKSYQGMSMSFAYDEKWPMAFHARPSNNGMMRSNAQDAPDILNFLCLHIWHFTYDAIYPVKVTITDSMPGFEPYQFSFPFKVSVDHNQPRRENFAITLLEQADLGSQEEYCNDVVNEMTIYTTTNTTDSYDVADVNLTFTCGIFSCSIGKTEWQSFGAAAALVKSFPYCVNGILRGNKAGFEESEMFIRTEIPSTYTLYMTPIREFWNYEIVKHDFDTGEESPLADDEHAQITIKSKGGFESFGVYPNNQGLPIKLLDEDKEYDITVYIADEESIIGGYQGTWKVSRDDLGTASRIIFHALEKKGSEDEVFLFISGLKSYSQRIPNPELK